MAFVEGEFYHIYNRGVEKRTIYTSATDYRRFLALLYLSNSSESVRMDNLLKTHTSQDILTQKRGAPLVAIGAFCLMPNHFHLLLTPVVKSGLSKFMLKVQTGYSMYFNTKNDRSGSLFQGPFKGEHVARDEHLKYLYSYIHLNPAKLKDVCWKERTRQKTTVLNFVEEYPYSSYGSYLSGKHTITDPTPFPEYFSTPKEVRKHLTDWLSLET